MSIFDPFSLYVHRQVSTKKGQVLQKKPYNDTNIAVSPQQVQQANNILHSIGVATIPLPYFNNILERTAGQRFESNSLDPGVTNVNINQIIDSRRSNFADISSIPLENIDYMRLQVLVTEIYVSHTSADPINVVIYSPNFTKNLNSDVRAVGILSTSAARNHYIGRKDDLTAIFDTIVKDPNDEFVCSTTITDKSLIKDIFDNNRTAGFLAFRNNAETTLTITTNFQVIINLAIKLK